jgi:hypothetical protein
MVVEEDHSQYYALTQQARRERDAVGLQSGEKRKRINDPAEYSHDRKRFT